VKAWPWIVPALSVALLVAGVVAGVGPLLVILCIGGLVGAVATSVHHAEVVAHRVGEPFGTLVLAVAVTVIEASLILSMMLAGGAEVATGSLPGHGSHAPTHGPSPPERQRDGNHQAAARGHEPVHARATDQESLVPS